MHNTYIIVNNKETTTNNTNDNPHEKPKILIIVLPLSGVGLSGMHPGIHFGYFEFPEFTDTVSGEIFLFKVHIYGLPANAEIFCDFFDGEPSVFYQIKLFHCNIPETPKLSFFRKRCHHIPFGIIYQYYREISNRNARKSVSFMQFY